jgi:hypothetical protein
VWALQLNDYAAKEVVAKHPDRFGFFAFLPMPGAEPALQAVHCMSGQLLRGWRLQWPCAQG